MKKIITIVILILVISSSSFVYLHKRYSPPAELEVHFIDVGQGDATLIRTPSGKNMLIDAATKSKSALVSDYIKSEGVKKLDVVIATHPDEDHIGGMTDIIKKFDIGTFYMPNKMHNTITFEHMLVLLKKENILVSEALSGNIIPFDEEMELLVLNPENKDYPNNNAFSIATKLTYQDTSFLFTGDIEAINEYAMINNFGENLQSKVIKLAHHGSNSSNSPDFLKTVRPVAAVVSCAYNNQYNHPSESVLKTLKNLGIPLYRTDLQGSIVFFSDGKTINVNQTSPYESE